MSVSNSARKLPWFLFGGALAALIVCSVFLGRYAAEIAGAEARYEELRLNVTRLELEAKQHLARAQADADSILQRARDQAEAAEAKAREQAETLNEQATMTKQESEREAKAILERAQKSADSTIAKAKAEAAAISSKAENLATMMDGKMRKIYPDLHIYQEGVNRYENGTYLESFERSGDRMIITMRNRTSRSIRPRLNIALLDKHGFLIASVIEYWLLDSIDPGGKRVQDSSVSVLRRSGEPYYYTVEE